MSDHSQEKEDLVKKDYVLMLEQELGIKFESDNDFINFATINNDFIVEPTKYQNYFKPCFDFVIKEDGVEITNSLAKDFYDMGLEVGMKITKVNGETLSGKGYFEILEKMYAKNYEEEKKFTLSNNQEINYKYIGYDNRYNFDEENKILYLYDLDIVNQENIYEFYSKYPEMVLDLSKATANTFDGIKNFVSLFSIGKEPLFKTPEGIKTSTGRKITHLKIILGENKDDGILFALTSISRLNSNIKIVEKPNDEVNVTLNMTTFYGLKELKSSNYTIYIKNFLMEARNNLSGEIVI